MNIDGTRIGVEQIESGRSGRSGQTGFCTPANGGEKQFVTGRFPSNLLLSEQAAFELDVQSGISKKPLRLEEINKSIWGASDKSFKGIRGYGDSGGASRFFYVAKTSKRERNAGLEGMPLVLGDAMAGGETRPDRPPNSPLRQNHHPTVKPIRLMEYLCRLITPPNGVILDPFMGSGSTGVAAILLKFSFIGIEKEKDYIEISKKRLLHAKGKR